MTSLAAIIRRELILARRIGAGAELGIVFFLILISVVPFAIGADQKLIGRIAPALLWLAALLATLLGLDRLLQADEEDGIVDALIDNIVFAIGTLDAFGVDAYTAWNRVHAANMAKNPGVKPGRPNPYGFPDLIKPEGWTAPTHQDNVGLVAKAFE